MHFPQLSGIGGTEGNLIALFQEEHGRVLQLLQNFSFFPENLPLPRKPFEKKTLEKQNSKKQVQGPVSTTSVLNLNTYQIFGCFEINKSEIYIWRLGDYFGMSNILAISNKFCKYCCMPTLLYVFTKCNYFLHKMSHFSYLPVFPAA